MSLLLCARLLGSRRQADIELSHLAQVLLVQILHADHSVTRVVGRGEQFGQLELQRDAVFVLALDQEHIKKL